MKFVPRNYIPSWLQVVKWLGTRWLWHTIFLDSLFPYPVPCIKATLIIKAITLSSTKRELQILPPFFLVGGNKWEGRAQGLGHLGRKPRATQAMCTGHLTAFLHLQSGDYAHSIIAELSIKWDSVLKNTSSLEHRADVNYHYYSGHIMTVDEIMSGTCSGKRS